MKASLNVAVKLSSAAIGFSAITRTHAEEAQTPGNAEQRLFEVSQRLRKGLAFNELKSNKPSPPRPDKLELYRPKEHFGKFARDGYPIARVASLEIPCGYQEIIDTWVKTETRHMWDSTVVPKVNRTVDIGDGNGQVNHVYEKSVAPILLIPPRDYVYRQHRSSGGLVGVENFTAISIVQVDCHDTLDRSYFFVRGRMNSVLLLEPKGERRTQVTLVIEKDPMGWSFFSPFLANLFAGEIAGTMLLQLKKMMDGEQVDEDKDLSVEQIAQKQFRKKLEQEEERKRGLSIVEDTNVSRVDLLETIVLLEKKLSSLKATERSERIDLSVLKEQVEHDLDKARSLLGGNKVK